MAKKTKRTQLKDLAVGETELTMEEARGVKGGMDVISTSPVRGTVPTTNKSQTPLPPAPSTTTDRQTPKRDFGD